MSAPRATGTLALLLAAIPPASGAVVMGTGIVSIGLALDGRETLSRLLLAAAVLAWVALGLLLVGRALFDRERVDREARSPAALTGVAGTAVLGARFTLLGWSWATVALLAIAAAFWLVLLAPVLAHWATPTVGVSLVLVVSTESLAVLSAGIAQHQHARWLLHTALVPFGLGLAFYVWVISRFDLRQLETGRGDQWITGGALAISTLAAANLAIAVDALRTLAAVDGALKVTSVVLWTSTIAWLPILLAAEARHPRLGYDVRRWATVFPVGMYAVCSFLTGSAVGAPAITTFARVWVWVGLAVWLVVALATLARGVQIARGRRSPPTSERIDELAPSRREARGAT